MLRFLMLTVVIVLVMSANLCSAGEKQTPSEAPTAEFISASLRNQLHKSAVKVTYYVADDVDGECDIRATYLRSPNFWSYTGERGSELAWGEYDKKTGLSRSYVIDQKNRLVGIITDYEAEGLTVAELPDPILHNMPTGKLADIIGSGTVSEKPEVVDGNSCWRVDITPRERPNDLYSVYVDTKIDCLPRKIVCKWRGGQIDVSNLSSYENIGGIWYPKQWRWEATGASGKPVHRELKIAGVELVSEAAASKSRPFPSGTIVVDMVNDLEYTIP